MAYAPACHVILKAFLGSLFSLESTADDVGEKLYCTAESLPGPTALAAAYAGPSAFSLPGSNAFELLQEVLFVLFLIYLLSGDLR